MPVATVTSKGQVTIPKEVRDRLRLRTGDQLDFVVGEKGEITVRKRALRVDQVFGAFAHPERTGLSVEQLDEAIARSLAKADR